MSKTTYKLNRGITTQKFEGKTAVFSGEKSILFTLNDSAEIIYNGLKFGWEKEKIIEKLTDKFEVDKKSAEKDIEEFTKLLLEKEILIPSQ